MKLLLSILFPKIVSALRAEKSFRESSYVVRVWFLDKLVFELELLHNLNPREEVSWLDIIDQEEGLSRAEREALASMVEVRDLEDAARVDALVNTTPSVAAE